MKFSFKAAIKSKTTQGFTIIELSLALVFLSTLLLSIAFLSMHLMGIYQKGLSIKAVSSTSRNLIDDFSRTISSSSALSKETIEKTCNSMFSDNVSKNNCKKTPLNFVYNQVYYPILIDGQVRGVPFYGSFCTGQYSYIWNTGYALNENQHYKDRHIDKVYSSRSAVYKGKKEFHLLKVQDPNYSVCTNRLKNKGHPDNYYDGGQGEPEELLSSSEDKLIFYDFVIFEPTVHENSSHAFYSGTFILGTTQGNIDIASSSDHCREQSSFGLATEANYCAINKFNFAAQAIGESPDYD